jgi:hypothetical protein
MDATSAGKIEENKENMKAMHGWIKERSRASLNYGKIEVWKD